MTAFLKIESLFLLLTLAVNLMLSSFIYFKSQRSEVSKSFSAFLLSIAFWTGTLLLFLHAHNSNEALILRRFTPIGSAFLMAFFLFFSLVFPKTNKKYSLVQKGAIFFPPFIFAVLSLFTNMMIESVVFEKNLPLYLAKPVFGIAYKAYLVYMIGYFVVAISNLIWKYLKLEGREKMQVWYVLFGTALTGAISISASLILPFLGITGLFTLGPLFTLIMGGTIYYAIVKHRLLNIENLLSQGVLFFNFIIACIATVVLVMGRFDLVTVASLWAFMANLTLALYVYLRNPGNQISRIFCAFVLSVAFWILGILVFRNCSVITPFTYFWAEVFYASGTLVPIFFIYFSYCFPAEKPRITYGLKITLFLIAIFLWWTIFSTEWVIHQIIMKPWGPEVILGGFYRWFTLLYLFLMGYAFLNLFRKFIAASGVDRVQLKYVLMGTFTSAVIGVIFNLILPFLGNYQLIWVGPSCSIIFVVFTAYAILRHRLMSIEVVIQKGAIYTVATALIMAVYAAAVVVSETFFRGVLGYTSLAITAGATLLIAVAYQPLVKSFQSLTDVIFFKDHYDYQKTLSKFSRALTSAIRTEELAMFLTYSFVKTIRVSQISFLLPDKGDYASVHLHLPQYKNIRLDGESPVIAWLKLKKDVLVTDEIEEAISRHEYEEEDLNGLAGSLKFLHAELTRLSLPLWVPIIAKDKLVGILALGEKLSGDIFTAEDIALLNTLANQTAVSLENARLYDEVVSVKDYNEEILQSMLNGIITTDARGRIVTCNAMAEKIIGKKRSGFIGRTAKEVWGEDEQIIKIIENTLKDRCYHNFEGIINSFLKGEIPVSFSSTLLRDSYGKKSGSLVVLRDLSDVKELEEKVRRADKLSALATMAAGMAHEIKNPLSSMKVFAQLLPQKYNDNEYRKKLEEILPREIDRIDRVVENLISFARSTTPTFEKIKIESLLEETLKYYEDKAKGAGVKINRQYAELPEIEVDPGQMSQVFSNLVLNAIQAMTEGGELTVSSFIGKFEEEKVKNIKVQIADTGPGLSEEMLKKLFEPFFTTKHGGTGLGLTITHSIVESHKGSMEVESQVGKGTIFTVILPVKQ